MPVLELCCFEWFQNSPKSGLQFAPVLELCCFEWFQNIPVFNIAVARVLELCCFEWFQNLCEQLSQQGQFQSCVVSNGSKTRDGVVVMALMVLELCCFEWFQNHASNTTIETFSFRAVLFRMVPKPYHNNQSVIQCFRAVLFRMVPKHEL